jgi:hypothetical protein
MKLSRLLALAAVGFVASLFFTKGGRRLRKDFSIAADTVMKNGKKNLEPVLEA